MYTRKHVAAAMLALAVGTAYSGAASSATVLTWDPAGSSPALSTAGSFSFDNITLKDWAALTFTGGPSNFTVTDDGYLPIALFSLGGSPVVNPGLNGSLGASTYSMYFAFNANANVTCTSPGNCSGAFTSINYSLDGNKGATATFSVSGSTVTLNKHGGTTVVLGSGVLAPFPLQNQATVTAGVPSAAIDVTFNQAAGEGGFFVAPPATVLLMALGSFINNVDQVTTYCPSKAHPTCPAGDAQIIDIAAGGGSLEFVGVPEPASLSLLGAGLLLTGIVARGRRNRKSS